MGGGEMIDPVNYEMARKLGFLIAKEGGKITIGILPGDKLS